MTNMKFFTIIKNFKYYKIDFYYKFILLLYIIKMFLFIFKTLFGTTPSKKKQLIDACFYSDEKKIKELLKSGEDPNFIDENGKTPLYWAAYSGENIPVKILLSSGANPNLGESPILPSGEFNIMELVKAKTYLTNIEKNRLKLIYPQLFLNWTLGSNGNLKNMPQFIKERAITAILCLRKASNLPNELIYYIIEFSSY